MKKYSTKWIVQRVTAIVLIPLCFWFIYHCISFQNLSYEEIVNFFSSFINGFLFLVLMITMLIHSQLGCETIIEDYISSRNYKILGCSSKRKSGDHLLQDSAEQSGRA